MSSPKKIAILASGSGTNAQKIFETFESDDDVKVVALMSNKSDAYALKRAENFNIPTFVFNREDSNSGKLLERLNAYEVDLVVLAGFLWKIPDNITKVYKNRIINIHPSLLPKYGGKGMYGMNVHQAVVDAKEKESGITIHYVNEFYDEGEVIFQATCEVLPTDTPDSLAQKIHALEYANFPRVIKETLSAM
ncbi:phosphoribosylglycinamide formyltransferase [Aureibacter tunicatorum]|uniref:Phosphoribosylglycinamide formyltransferase n=1 Tax=Aureibacter tunicatorum TaxID=866807 RepID=A0AAE4BS02_9BACT|nr:phosphoribosylglycinamide formyltransferase [Aureibacter tunicatorum]MDR6238393.1 phosphoribosylglycinamide formyltransferase-1 [Aureibacter tunicatorum]BDD03425.1 phosphoribosylglycinamide formyltransferase [Aureibacter tunicatorum]